MDDSNAREEVIEIKGMHCKSCAEKIESKLSQLEGVEKARVSLVEEKAYVRLDKTKTNVDKIKEEIASIGYATDLKIEPKKTSIKQGIAYGLIPHIGCIAFIFASIFGATVATEFFKPLLLNPYFFYILVGISFSFATVSAIVYLRRQGFTDLSAKEVIGRKWKYLSTLYGTTIGVNLLLFLVIFPLLANATLASPSNTGTAVPASNGDGLSSLKLTVDIPCSGHASLITGELKSISGVGSVQFSLPNVFDVKYDSTKTSKQQILSLDVFKTYKATVLDETSTQNNQISVDGTVKQTNLGGGSCCGSGSCRGSSGCGCGGG